MIRIRNAFLLTLLVPGLVVAHAGLVKSVPGSRATLTHAPSNLELCFNEAVELSFSMVSLLDPSKEIVPLDSPKLGDDPKCIRAALPDLAAGTYTVNYRVLSQDGHVVEYGYQFTIKPDPDLKK